MPLGELAADTCVLVTELVGATERLHPPTLLNVSSVQRIRCKKKSDRYGAIDEKLKPPQKWVPGNRC